MAHDNAALIERFYAAFNAHDGDGMAACYADDVDFSDEVFPGLKGERARNMWRMLCERGKDLRLETRDVVADDTSGSAHWDAYYTFQATGRRVHNSIDARFTFRDGKIATHKDTFSFWRWSRQALGAPGVLLGWAPFLRKKVQATARAGLDAFEAKRGA